jgi:uncharacterized protein (TIGR00369 family)
MDTAPSPPADFDPETLIRTFAKNGHNRLIGTQYHAHGPGWCELALPYDARLARDVASGILASGPIFTLMDMATSISIWLRTGFIQPQATLDLRVDYLRPAEPGRTIIGHGECYHVTRSIAFIRGIAHDGDADRPVAHVAGTYFFTAS